MPRINTYTDNTSIEDDDKLLTYDTQGAATKLTAFSRIWTWIQSKIHAITASTSAWTAANDKVVVDRNGTLSRIDYSILAKAIVESYNGSTLAGSAQAVKTAIDALNSKLTTWNIQNNGSYTSACDILFLCRYYNGATKTAIYLRDFSETAHACLNTFDSGEVTVTYSSGTFSIQNNLNGVITAFCIKF